LFLVVERGFPEQEAALRRMGERFQSILNDLCDEARRDLQPIFDRWIVSVDPQLRNLRRNRSDYATTSYPNQSSVFHSRFFDLHPYLRQGGEPTQFFTFSHEFRHLMAQSERLYPGAAEYLKARIEGRAHLLPVEQDADSFARKFIVKDCSCAK
jgi:PAS domain-containing protein